MKSSYLYLVILSLVLSACSPGASQKAVTPTQATRAVVITGVAGTAQPGPQAGTTEVPPSLEATQAPVTSAAGDLSPAALKYRILEAYPNFFYCDPDEYPVAHEDEMGLGKQRFPEIQADAQTYNAILEHLGMQGQTSFGDEQVLAIYQEYKKLNSMLFNRAGSSYRFHLLVGPEGQGFAISGRIDLAGKITEAQRISTIVTCPVCLARGTWIATPAGRIAVEALQPGMAVWSVGADGERMAAVVLRTSKTPVSAAHRMVHLRLADGRDLYASPGHPTVDGRSMADLRPGDDLDGSRIISLELVSYAEGATYDLLPSGPTNSYWANGILVGSTLAEK